jgi:hypothetical protein
MCKTKGDHLQKWVFVSLAIAAFLLAVFAPLVSAEEKSDGQSGWEFQVSPHIWFLSLDGDVTVKGQESDADMSFSDIWDELNIAGMITFEGRKDHGKKDAGCNHRHFCRRSVHLSRHHARN